MRLSNYTANLFVSENRTHSLDIPPCGGFGQQNNAIANVLLKNTLNIDSFFQDFLNLKGISNSFCSSKKYDLCQRKKTFKEKRPVTIGSGVKV